MKSIWYDIQIHSNVRYCSDCQRKVATNKKSFDFVFCPYCGDRKSNTEVIDKESLLKLNKTSKGAVR